jgi:hypothetical protein
MSSEALRVSRVDACVERILAWAGRGLRVAAPLGLGKPNVLLNALYRRAVAEPGLTLHLYTALSLTRPAAGSDLERRFLGPFLERHFGADYPNLEYAEARRAGRLPANVRISEFYLQSGAMLGNGDAQREYVSLNYTHAEIAPSAVATSPPRLMHLLDESRRLEFELCYRRARDVDAGLLSPRS